MTATSHALTGALIATVVRQPLLAVPLAFISHFICDALPHFGIDMKFGDTKMKAWLIIDGLILSLFATCLLIFGVTDIYLLAICAVVAMSPDLIWLIYGLQKKPLESYDKLTKFHASIQKFESAPAIIVDIIWSISVFGLIIRLQ